MTAGSVSVRPSTVRDTTGSPVMPAVSMTTSMPSTADDVVVSRLQSHRALLDPIPAPTPTEAPTRGRTRRRLVDLGGGPGAYRVTCSGATARPRDPVSADLPAQDAHQVPVRGGARPGDALPVPLTLRVRPREADCGWGCCGGRVGWPAMRMVPAARQVGQVHSRRRRPRRVRQVGGLAAAGAADVFDVVVGEQDRQRACRPACPPRQERGAAPRPETDSSTAESAGSGPMPAPPPRVQPKGVLVDRDGAEHLLDAERHRIRHRRLRAPQPPPIATTNHETCYHSGLSAANRLAEPCPLARRRSRGPPRPHGRSAAAQLRTQAGTGWLMVLFPRLGCPTGGEVRVVASRAAPRPWRWPAALRPMTWREVPAPAGRALFAGRSARSGRRPGSSNRLAG